MRQMFMSPIKFGIKIHVVMLYTDAMSTRPETKEGIFIEKQEIEEKGGKIGE